MPPLGFASLPSVADTDGVGNDVAIGPGIVPENVKEFEESDIEEASDAADIRVAGTLDVDSVLAEVEVVSLLTFVSECLLSSSVEDRSLIVLSPLGAVAPASGALLSLRKPNGSRFFAFALCDGGLGGT